MDQPSSSGRPPKKLKQQQGSMLKELTVSNEQRSLQVQKVAFGKLIA
ncbi:hypothetical protein [Endozoicomonas lisbonensis]|uniref:Transposase n=1 Tax=Endozoicomonas lisbonensis TaxID=3120522 RepID=A0ABV2SCP9_9GAMM